MKRTAGESICLIYLSALFMASIKDLEKALSATAVARQGRIYREALYRHLCRYES
jgi:DNA-binding phage protein